MLVFTLIPRPIPKSDSYPKVSKPRVSVNRSESVEPASQHFCTSRKELLLFFFHWNHSKTLRLSFPISSVLPSFLEFGSLVD
ncbi:hypothetical protein V6N11_049682 [Hibiscus sabdariffa]|uniref:Uncharacterized protein n=2 Tax=Hibiscus sabdariffa TaxID=183260 RepID=A0ABR1ZLC6_9ROSI